MKIVFVYGNFNIIHSGHIRILEYAKKFGSKLIVGIFSDKIAGRSAYVNQKLRYNNIKNNILVDECFLINNSLNSYIKKIKPNYVVKGKEYEKIFNPEEKIIKKYGGKLIFSSGQNIFSSKKILDKELKNNYSFIDHPKKFILRHEIDKQKIKKYFNKIKDLNIIVIGDTIVDDYIFCEAEGMSREDPALVVNPYKKDRYVGGAAIVASHAKSLGANVEFISIIGNDKDGSFLKKELSKKKIKCTFFNEEFKRTSVKTRYRHENKTLLRINNIDKASISVKTQNLIIDYVKNQKKKIHLVVYSDFNYGLLTQNLINKLNKHFLSKKISQVADCQSSSQLGNISKFKKMMLITPTEREARLSCNNYEDGLIILVKKLKNLSKAKNIILTLDKEGILIHPDTHQRKKYLNDKIEALNNNPVDVIGAGDSLFISSSLLLKSGANIWEASYFGSVCAAIQVSKLGNNILDRQELLDSLSQDRF